jgi:diguanylate cyclase (GGDEF)-like protein
VEILAKSLTIHAPDDDTDTLIFLDESANEGDLPTRPAACWRILIVDDDQDVHFATAHALAKVEIQRRSLMLLHASSAREARELLVKETDIAVVLLDVVMEQGDSGLELVRHIRQELNITDSRIILRTGQPGYAPEIEAIRDYDINDYKTKSDLTHHKLLTTLTTAIRSYEQIRALSANRRGLELIVRASAELMAVRGLQDFAAGVIGQIASLLRLEPECLICARDEPNGCGADAIVIAGAGSYQGHVNQPLSRLGDERIIEALSGALAQRRNVYGDSYTCIYFEGNAGRSLAAFIDTEVRPSGSERALLEVFCSNIAVGLDNVALVENLHKLAFSDPVLNLPNRARMIELLDAKVASDKWQAQTLAVVDVDHFAAINDTFGQQFGDELLASVAARIRTGLGGELVLARTGSDVFAVLGHADRVNSTSLLALFSVPFDIAGQSLQLSASIGMVALDTHQGAGVDALKNAEIALKCTKNGHHGDCAFFESRMANEIHERVRMMHALRVGFETGEFSLVYQPQIDLFTRRPVGAEALLRWRTSDGVNIGPDRFIPIAESSGLIVVLGTWVLREACAELVRLRRDGHQAFMMSINVSQAQFCQPDFIETLRGVLRETGAPAEYVELEITESMAMDDPAAAIRILGQIRQLGVSIALDDFGTGFSSLSYLSQLKIDRLKIDRSFVRDIRRSHRDGGIAAMMVNLGVSLGLTVIAEGVEDAAQAETLAKLGCPIAQGFFFARPMTAPCLSVYLAGKSAA